jgi:hypothetical protein
MATENRDVRPFRDLSDVQAWLEGNLHLVVTDATNTDTWTMEPGSTLRLDPKTLMTANVQLKIDDEVAVLPVLKSAEQFANDLGAKDHSVLSIVLYATSPLLRFTDEIARWSFDDLKQFRMGHRLNPEGMPRPRGLQLAHNGVVFDLVVLLNRELKPKAGMPHRLGTWLARIRFTLANPAEGIGFSPLPLTPEKRKELNLAKQTATYARENPYHSGLLAAIMLDDFVEYFVDESLLARMSANPRHSQSALFQTQIFLGAVEFVVMEFQRLDSFEEVQLADVNEGLIGKILRIVSDETDGNLRQWLEILKTKPADFLAAVEANSEYLRRLDDSMSDMAGISI